jgi:hypothetical protein
MYKQKLRLCCVNKMPCPVCSQPIEVEEFRNLDQNAKHWSLATLIGEAMGNTKEEASQVACVLLFGEKTVTFGDKVFALPYSTSAMKKSEFSQLIEKDIEICNFLSIKIPHIER